MVFEAFRDERVSDDFEQVVYCSDRSVGLQAIIALHSTALGPAVGGCRMWDYAAEKDALRDVLRLSKGMTYKASLAGLDWGGGKAVILGDPKTKKTPALLQRFGEFVEGLGGRYVTAKDVGIGADDLRMIKRRTRHVLGIEGEAGSSGDPSPATAHGVFAGMRAAVRRAYGAKSLDGMTIAIQGLGSVAYYLLDHLKGARRIVACDVSAEAIERARKKLPLLEFVPVEEIYDVACDVFAPCALGATVNPTTIPRLRTRVVAGAANNQLASPADGEELRRRGILYAPDYAINAGGLINIYYEGREGGYRADSARAHVARIESTIDNILARSEAEALPAQAVADRMAEERIRAERQGCFLALDASRADRPFVGTLDGSLAAGERDGSQAGSPFDRLAIAGTTDSPRVMH